MTRFTDEEKAAALAEAQEYIRRLDKPVGTAAHIERTSTFVSGYYQALAKMKMIDALELEDLSMQLSLVCGKHLERLPRSQ